MTSLVTPLPPSALGKAAGRASPNYKQQDRCIDELVSHLQERGVRSIILDWDGCVMPIRGDLHGAIALKALHASSLWQCYGAPLSMSDAKAAYEGDHRHLQLMFERLGGTGSAIIAPHGVPWDQLMGTNLIRVPLTAMGVSADLQDRVVEEFFSNLGRALATIDLAPEKPSSQDTLEPNPGTRRFLVECARRGIPIHVVTMTPTVLVKHFAQALGLDSLIESFQGCEQFPATMFPRAKHDASLWISSAQRQNTSITECAIVEDSSANIRSAVESGAAAVVSLSLKGNQSFEMLCGNHFTCLLSGIWASVKEPTAAAQLLDSGFDYGVLPAREAHLSLRSS